MCNYLVNKSFLLLTCPLKLYLPIELFQIVRLSLQFAEELLQNPELSALQIVYVVRDPRAVMK